MRRMNAPRATRPLVLSVLLHTGLVAALPPFVPASATRPLTVTIAHAVPDAIAAVPALPAPSQPVVSPRVRRVIAQPQATAAHEPRQPDVFAPQEAAAPQPAPSLVSVEKRLLTPARLDITTLDIPKPTYPPASRRLGEEGKVIIRVLVSAEGHATDVEISRSSGFVRLDEAARQAVSRWRFTPARQNGEAVADWASVPVVFALTD